MRFSISYLWYAVFETRVYDYYILRINEHIIYIYFAFYSIENCEWRYYFEFIRLEYVPAALYWENALNRNHFMVKSIINVFIIGFEFLFSPFFFIINHMYILLFLRFMSCTEYSYELPLILLEYIFSTKNLKNWLAKNYISISVHRIHYLRTFYFDLYLY